MITITKNPDGSFERIETRTIEIATNIPPVKDIDTEIAAISAIEVRRLALLEKSNTEDADESKAFVEQAKTLDTGNRLEQLTKWKLEVKDIK